MPTYEYECEACSLKFEVKRGFHEKGGDSCPQCGLAGKRIYFAPPLIFKGPGFYCTDSRTEKDPELEAKAKADAAEKALKEEPKKPVAKAESKDPGNGHERLASD